MSKYVTGFCSNGFHEGTRPKSSSGKPIKVCVAISICTCDCHVKLTNMYKLSGVERLEVQNPDYMPYESGVLDFIETYKKVTADLLDSTLPVTALVAERPAELTTGPAMAGLARSGRTFEPTMRGRAAGQLEDEIRDVCNRYLGGEFPDEVCTPKFIAQQIFLETDSEKPPSIGAIGAAFDRWERIGFAVVAKGPVRFVTFTVAGLQQGLEALKSQHKGSSRRMRSRS